MIVYVHGYFSAEYHYIWKWQLSKLEVSTRIYWVYFGFHWIGTLYLELSYLTAKFSPGLRNLPVQSPYIRKNGFWSPWLKGSNLLELSYIIWLHQGMRFYSPAARLQRDRSKPLIFLRPGVRTTHPTLPLSTSATRLLYGGDVAADDINNVFSHFGCHFLYCITNYIRISVFTKVSRT